MSSSPNFIGCWQLEADALCDALVAHFEAREEAQEAGKTGLGRIDESVKRSRDLYVRPKELKGPDFAPLRDYMAELQDCFRDYTAQWDFLGSFLTNVHIGGFNLQKYESGGHFGKLHAERTGLSALHPGAGLDDLPERRRRGRRDRVPPLRPQGPPGQRPHPHLAGRMDPRPPRLRRR